MSGEREDPDTGPTIPDDDDVTPGPVAARRRVEGGRAESRDGPAPGARA